MKKLGLLAIAFVFSAACAGDQAGSPAAANANANAENPVYQPSMEAAMKAAGLDVYETKRNKELWAKADLNSEKLKASLGESYAGSWFEYDSNNNAYQVIAVTRPVKIDKSLVADSNFKLIFVAYSLKTLESIMDKMVNIYMPSGVIVKPDILSMEVDIKNNRISVYIRPADIPAVYNELFKSGYDMGMINIKPQDGPLEHHSVIDAGTHIAVSSPTSPMGSRCTAAFNAAIDIYPVILTAGHCATSRSNQTVYFNDAPGDYLIKGALIGNIVYNDYNSAGMDSAIFANANFVHFMTARIKNGPSSFGEVRSPQALNTEMLNRNICTYGSVSGWRCGKLLALSIPARMPNGATLSLAKASYCGDPGDSGGPVVSEAGNILGIHSSAVPSTNYSCKAKLYGSFGAGAPGETTFQPIMPVLKNTHY
ncbi:MAG: S1 family peptidase [Burkholderiaceae bacterium]|jgi:streptogrisin C|nr:S1 family peptidase [Burkholderiaceae bacterium]